MNLVRTMNYPSLSLSKDAINQIFSNSQQLGQFSETKTELNDGVIHSCQHCDYKNSKKVRLYQHNRKHHTKQGEQTYACYDCEYTSTDKTCFGNHRRQRHRGMKHKCTECSYSNIFPSKLKTHHKQVHLGIPRSRQAKCQFKTCEQFAQTNCNTDTHFSFFCDQCDFSSGRNDTLMFHIAKTHDGIIYQCEFCDYNTARNRNLQRHIATIHQEVSDIKERRLYSNAQKMGVPIKQPTEVI